ncbi:MAG: HIT domain-containing protein, partial [Gammaproteobacteria bacterium]
MPFELHPRLAADTIPLGRFGLSALLLMNDSRYPWCILVPRRAGVREIHELREDDQVALLREIVHLSEHMQASFRAHKMNVAALGNQVPQLHVHVIARQTSDPAWPGPVWGVGEAIPYTS